MYPATQVIAYEQDVAVPPAENVPAVHFSHPSTLVVAPSLVAMYPARQVLGSHVVKEPPAENVPAEH